MTGKVAANVQIFSLSRGGYRNISSNIILGSSIQGGPTEFYAGNCSNMICMLFDRAYSINHDIDQKHTKYFYFRCKIQLDHPV